MKEYIDSEESNEYMYEQKRFIHQFDGPEHSAGPQHVCHIITVLVADKLLNTVERRIIQKFLIDKLAHPALS